MSLRSVHANIFSLSLYIYIVAAWGVNLIKRIYMVSHIDLA